MQYRVEDTICAIATARGGAARSMVRISGPSVVGIVEDVFQPHEHVALASLKKPQVIEGSLRIGWQCEDSHSTHRASRDETRLETRYESTIPCDLFLWPTARSYTREPVAELHTVGSPPVLQAVLATVCRAGARLAEPGEFTLRAFLAGRLDLTQAEAVLGVIDAHDESDLHTALTQLAGGMARPMHALREILLQLLAELEAGLDFVEEDIEFITRDEVLARLEQAHTTLVELASQLTQRHTTQVLPRVALLGEPNAGKSSLFNALVQRFAASALPNVVGPTSAIVSPTSGTTRDYLTATLDLGGLKCQLMDTAGIDPNPHVRPSATGFTTARATASIEAAAQAATADCRRQAAVRIWCIPMPAIPACENDPAIATRFESFVPPDCELVVFTKSDLVDSRQRDLLGHVEIIASTAARGRAATLATSSTTGEGLDALHDSLRAMLVALWPVERSAVVANTADRCRQSIFQATAAIDEARSSAAARAGDEFVASELRTALHELGQVVGTVYTEDLLDRIFRTFCIGK